jgi:hypothetical protein
LATRGQFGFGREPGDLGLIVDARIDLLLREDMAGEWTKQHRAREDRHPRRYRHCPITRYELSTGRSSDHLKLPRLF